MRYLLIHILSVLVIFSSLPTKLARADEKLLKILPPKERWELQRAIRQTQEVLKNIKVFSLPGTDEITKSIPKSLNTINKRAQEQIKKDMEKHKQEFQQRHQIDTKKIEEYFKQNPPAGPIRKRR
ncbi:MAG: hypothetical protein KJ706_06255 [Candidatus Omnitrophica bacterium]|nr:hypothetical protein [Candidatus Omnitrophota bacterium]